VKIVIVGPGAMGSLFAAYLSKSKEELWILDKDKNNAAKLNQQGIIIEGISGNWQAKVKVSADAGLIGEADLIIICVKSYHTRKAIIRSKSLVGENSKVLTLQNGLGNIEAISEVVGSEKVIGGVTSEGATLMETGKIRHAGRGDTIIGRIDSKSSAGMSGIRELFNKVGMDTKISRDIKSLLWSKLIINVGINALTAITGLRNGKLIEFDGVRKILRGAVAEATRIAKRKRIKLIYDDPLAKVEAVCEATAGNVSSMLQDVLRGKTTEIDFINGVIVRLGEELGIAVPINSTLVDLVKTIESTYHLTLKK